LQVVDHHLKLYSECWTAFDFDGEWAIYVN
jgi:hypothetical protein